ncbi:MAG: protein-methionine-sulfoxide reductase catalytic subunit MsrP [Pseudomonadota bacterium]
MRRRNIKPEWMLPEGTATSEAVFLKRREFVAALGLGGALAVIPQNVKRAFASQEDPSASLYPVPRNEKYTLERPITPEAINTRYNNFYEFGSHKQIFEAAQALKIRPWEIAIDGEVEKPFKIAIDDLLKQMPLEERLYRHRCVEAWSMRVPWSGFQLSNLVDLAKPTSNAKYVRFETFENAEVAPGQKQFWYPWPYVEGMTIDEAMNELTFMVTGAYGKPVPKQMGAPLRLALPWKYGFKSIKSISKISFMSERPVSFWEELLPSEYGFWANVNPDVSHPRWSQATERDLESSERIPTQLFNGYGAQVADLYKGMDQKTLYM